MKKSTVEITISAVLTIVILVLAAGVFLLAGCRSDAISLEEIQDAIVKGPPLIEEVLLCEGKDENSNPVDPAEGFPAGTDSICLVIKFKDFTPQEDLRVVWSYTYTGNELSVQEYSPEVYGSGYHYFNITNAESFQPGKYKAEIYFNGEFFREIEFAVNQS